MTIHVPLKEAKNRLSELVRSFERGERVVVTRNGHPVFEMARPQRGGLDFEALRRWKAEKGVSRITGPMAPDFNDPFPEDYLSTPLT